MVEGEEDISRVRLCPSGEVCASLGRVSEEVEVASSELGEDGERDLSDVGEADRMGRESEEPQSGEGEEMEGEHSWGGRTIDGGWRRRRYGDGEGGGHGWYT